MQEFEDLTFKNSKIFNIDIYKNSKQHNILLYYLIQLLILLFCIVPKILDNRGEANRTLPQ